METKSVTGWSPRLLISVAAPAYWFLLAIIYSGNYWRWFGINVLEFASLSDLLQLSIFPVLASVAGGVLGTFLGYLPRDFNHGRYTKGELIGIVLVMSTILLIGLRAAILLAVILAYVYIGKRVSSLQEVYENSNVRATVFAILFVVVPLYAYLGGETNANRVLNSTYYTYAEFDGIEHRYIGTLGGYGFFTQFDPDRVLIVNLSDTSTLELFKKPGFPDHRPNFVRWWLDGDSSSGDSVPLELTPTDPQPNSLPGGSSEDDVSR